MEGWDADGTSVGWLERRYEGGVMGGLIEG